MDNSELNNLLYRFSRLYNEMQRYSEKYVELRPGFCFDIEITSLEVGRLFSYIMDYDPGIYPIYLQKIIAADWNLLVRNWFIFITGCFRHGRIESWFYKNKSGKWFYIADREGKPRVKFGLVKNEDLDFILNTDKIPLFSKKARELKEILGLINELKYWASFQEWQKLQNDTTTEPQQEQPAFALPPELDTPRAREYFNKAEEAGFIAKTSTGYKWTSDNINECAYFCAFCSDALNLSKRKNRDGEWFTSWRPFSPVFGYSTDQLRNAKNEWRNKTGTMAEVYKEIEALFR